MGFAQGFAAGAAVKQNKQALALQRSQGLLKSNAGVMERLAQDAATIAQRGIEAGRSREEIIRSIEPLRKSFERSALDDVGIRSRLLGQPMTPESAMSTFESSLSLFDSGVLSGLSAQTPEEAAVLKAGAGVAGAVQTAKSLTEAGVEKTVSQTAESAGLIPAEEGLTFRSISDEEGNEDIVALDKEGNVVRRIEGGPRVVFQPTTFEKGTKKGAEERVLATQQLLRNIATLSASLEDSSVGAIPAFRGFLNTTVAQFAPETFDRDRAQFERFTKLTRQAALRVVSDESRFSEADREFIFDLFPDTGVFESVPNAEVKLAVMQAFFLRRMEGDLQASNIDPQTLDLGTSPENIRDAVNSGFLSQDEAVRILATIWPDRFEQ